VTRERTNLSPAAAGSLLLHLGVVALLMVSWPWARDLKMGAVVPVNIVANAPSTDLRPAVQAPEEQSALTEAPIADAPVQEVTPEPAPTPTPPAPQPAARPAPTPPAARPAPKTPAPQKAAQPAAKPAKPADLDFDALLASVSKAARASGGRQSSAARGPSRAETATQARPDLGKGLAASAIAGLSEELQRRWNPNCDVEGGRDVQIRTTFTLGISGQVLGEVRSEIRGGPASPVAQAAAERATRAVYAAAPFKNLPQDLYGQRIGVNFNARQACS
jgi:outer membrane biosynthesis protein TonB